MRVGSYLVFDNVITGAGPWYSGAEFNRLIGQADMYAVQTYATSVGGSSPTVTVASEMSGDSQNWIATGVTEISAQAISTMAAAAGSNNGATYLAANVRLKITIGGTSGPQCRLKIYVTCRSKGG